MKRLLAALLAATAALSCTGAFWRRKPKEGEEWTGPFSAREYAAFLELVRGELKALGVRGRIEHGQVYVEEGELQGRYGLENLAQVCRQQERHEWPATVKRHFVALSRAERERQATGPRSFSEAAPLLAVRVWPQEFIEQVGREHAVFREDLPGTVTVLVYDLPETIEQVRPEDVAAWGKPVEALFALGTDNLRRKPRPEIRRAELPGGVRVTVFSGNSFFIASEALRLSQFPGCTGRHGALVGVPTRHALIAYPIDGVEVVKAMMLLAPVVLGICSQGPGTVSPRVYWWHEGQFTDLPYIVRDRKVEFAPPREFIALVKELGGQAE